jgi:NADH-quinone oxidoreductase subunit N
MLGLAGIPAPAGFIGKFYLIDASVSGGYTWLGVVIVVGSMISLGYYLPVIAAMWMREAPAAGTSGPEPGLEPLPALAGGSSELDSGGAADSASPPDPSARRSLEPEVALVALLAGAATIFFGVIPQPLFDLVHGVGAALGLL